MFGGSPFGGFGQDPFYGMQQQHMQMMSSMDPFAGIVGRPVTAPQQQQLQLQYDRDHQRRGERAVVSRHNQMAAAQHSMMGGGDIFGHINQMMGNMNQMMAGMHSQMHMGNMQQPSTHMAPQMQPSIMGAGAAPMYSHQSVMTFSSDGRGGQPRVYQASKTTTNAGNGVRETKQTVRDSAQGIAKMALDRQIGERRHCVTKQQDLRSGAQEENHDYNNIDEEEAPAFHEEFQQRATTHRHPQRAIGGQRHSPHHRPAARTPHHAHPRPHSSHHQQQQQQQQPAICYYRDRE